MDRRTSPAASKEATRDTINPTDPTRTAAVQAVDIQELIRIKDSILRLLTPIRWAASAQLGLTEVINLHGNAEMINLPTHIFHAGAYGGFNGLGGGYNRFGNEGLGGFGGYQQYQQQQQQPGFF